MSTYVDNNVTCDCGHQGTIHLHESDGPFGNMWEQYSLEGLNGESFRSETPVGMKEALEEMNVSCPNCDARIQLRHLTWR